MRVYTKDANDLDLLIFELHLNGIPHEGPDCLCGKGCELVYNRKCEELFITVDIFYKDEVIKLAEDEADLPEFRTEV